MTDHIVILHKKWLGNLVSGEKTVEFRASERRIAPWEKVHEGDRLWMKQSGGPVVAVGFVEKVEYSGPLTADALDLILGELEEGSLDAEWKARLQSQQYVTCVWTHGVEACAPIDVSDVRGARQDAWQVLDAEDANTIATRFLIARDAAEARADLRCLECEDGKHPNCAGWALYRPTDEILPCPCKANDHIEVAA